MYVTILCIKSHNIASLVPASCICMHMLSISQLTGQCLPMDRALVV